MKIHCCLVSEQPLANVLPAVDRAHGCQRAVLVVTPQMREQAAHQARVLRGYGREVELLELPSAYDLGSMVAALEQWLDRASPAAEVELNATGGTKLMALAAQDVFRRRGLAVFYVSEASGDVVYLDARKSGFRLGAVLDLHGFVAAHGGHEVARRDGGGLSRPDQVELSRFLGQHAQRFCTALLQLKQVLSVLDGLRSRQPCRAETAALRELIVLLKNKSLLHVDARSHLYLADRSVFGYLSGGWLEDYTLLSAQAVGGIHSLVASLKVANGGPAAAANDAAASRNEMDVAWLADNRLYALECKTMAKPVDYNDVIYKAAFQRWIGGHSTRIGIVGLVQPTPLLEDRARAARIRLFGLDALPDLAGAFRRWVRPAG